MKFTLSWLREYLETNASADSIASTLTSLGLEVDEMRYLGKGLEPFTVAEILEAHQHPNADKLRVCRVLAHDGERQVVCGAPNARAGIKVILADIGDEIPTNGLKIKAAKIRDVESFGMLCSARELGIGADEEGIMELSSHAVVGEKIIHLLGLDDTLFDVAITPNRGDCLGVYGIARDLAVAQLGTLKISATPAFKVPASHYPVRIDTQDCSHFVAYEIEGVSNGESPDWLKRRLESVGMRSISALVDITNYMTVAFGRPLHVYDARHINGGLTVRSSREGEQLHALNDKEYLLPEGLCVIADNVSVLGIGGIIGGVASGCSVSTTHVILEAAWFEPVAIAYAGRRLGIDSDARYRFERTVDPAGTEPYAALAASMILDICGGRLVGKTITGQALLNNTIISYRPEYTRERTGLQIETDQQCAILERLGCSVTKDWQVSVPSWRADIQIAADIAEEIARIVGYDHLPLKLLSPAAPAIPRIMPEDKARSVLLSRGMDEAVHFAFTSRLYAKAFQDKSTLIEVSNPISSELSVMRPHLYADLLPALKRNHDRGNPDMALFEIGAIFSGVEPEKQPVRIAGVRTGYSPLHWKNRPVAADIYDVKADLYALLEALDMPVASLSIQHDVPAWYHPGKSGRISLGAKQVFGYFGEIHPAILRTFGLETPVYAFECLLDQLPLKQKAKRPEAFSPIEYQASRRDFAFIVPASLEAGEIEQAIAKADKQLIRHIRLFDVYQGEHIAPGNKSLAFAVTLQAKDRTLSEQDIQQISDAIILSAAKKGAVLR